MATREATVTDRVARGAALLDSYGGFADEPSDEAWWNQIDLDKLDMRIGYPDFDNGCGCILTQLYGGFGIGKDELEIDSLEAEEFGFEAMGVPLNIEYEALLEVWSELIEARRSK
jgi:hypothetical protein